MEKSLDSRIAQLWTDTPYLLIGTTRGVYLDGYGAVFTAEVNLVSNPSSMMSASVSKADIARVHAKRLERMPLLKKAMCDALIATAASLDTVPADEQVAIVAFLDYFPWEDPTVMPARVTVQGQSRASFWRRNAPAAPRSIR